MAIRIERDGPERSRRDRNNDGGGGNFLLKMLPFILFFFFKRPKLGLALLLILGAAYYFSDGFDGMLSVDENTSTLFSTGADYDEVKYDRTLVFPALASNHKNNFPSQVSLLQYAPQRRNQGRQGSCVGWASAYAAHSILYAQATGENPERVAFSPAFLYNQIALSGCQGAYLSDALKSMSEVGSLPFQSFLYDETSCEATPSYSQKSQASAFKILGYNRLSQGGYDYEVDIEGIRQNIAQGAPVVIGMQVGGSFMTQMYGQSDWRPTSSDRKLRGFSGHAMAVIGYDDNRNGGSFQVMNSWGKSWGDNGVFWIRYSDFEYFVKEAYGLSPMQIRQEDANKLAVKFGIIDKVSRQNIPLRRIKSNVYRTQIAKEQRFKLEVTNATACHIYILTEEIDGSTTVLFPYEKYSPYCGVVGTRLFPEGQSLYPDEDGNLDRFAILVAKSEIDINQLNRQIKNSRANGFREKVMAAIGTQHIRDISFKDGMETIDFEGDLNGRNVASIIIEVSK